MMLLRRQELIDRFDANFRNDADGQVIFQPPGSRFTAPVSADEYHAVLAAFERRQIISMAVTWLAFGAAGIYGIYQVVAFDGYAAFFIGLGAACAVSFALSFQDHTSLLQPFMERRDALREEQSSASR